MTRFIVMEAAAKVPSSWTFKHNYRKVAVVETDLPEGERPARIDERDKHVIRIVNLWTPVAWGSTERCAYRRAVVDAHEMAEKLNREAVS